MKLPQQARRRCREAGSSRTQRLPSGTAAGDETAGTMADDSGICGMAETTAGRRSMCLETGEKITLTKGTSMTGTEVP